MTPTHYIGTLIGRNGVHLKKLCEEYNIDSVHLGEEIKHQRRHRVAHFIYTSPVKVTYKYKSVNEKGHLFESALIKRAALVKENREKHFEMVIV